MSGEVVAPVVAVVDPALAAEPGYTTTEFWGKTILQVLSVILGLAVTQGRIDTNLSATVLTVATIAIPAGLEVAYVIARSIRKKGTPGK